MIHLTNVVVQAKLNVSIDLWKLTYQLRDVKYDPSKFSALIWHHRKIGGCCLVFNSGHIISHGATTMDMARRRVRQYARIIQKCGYAVNLKRVNLVTASAVATLGCTLDLNEVAKQQGVVWEPEIFNGLNFYKESVHFSCFTSGKCVVTGIKSIKLIEAVIRPTLLELSL